MWSLLTFKEVFFFHLLSIKGLHTVFTPLSTIYIDGDSRLVICTQDKRLLIFRGITKLHDITLLETPNSLAILYTDTVMPRIPSIAVAAGPYVFVYRLLRPHRKVALSLLIILFPPYFLSFLSFFLSSLPSSALFFLPFLLPLFPFLDRSIFLLFSAIFLSSYLLSSFLLPLFLRSLFISELSTLVGLSASSYPQNRERYLVFHRQSKRRSSSNTSSTLPGARWWHSPLLKVTRTSQPWIDWTFQNTEFPGRVFRCSNHLPTAVDYLYGVSKEDLWSCRWS